MTNFKQLCEDLENKIKTSYEEGTTVSDAEKLAGEFLYAQMKVSDELKAKDLDARMRKSGLKAVRAALYLEAATKDVKKPTEAMIDAMVTSHEVVQSEQNALDNAEVERDSLNRYYDIFGNAHIYYRGISKGRFE